MSLKQDISGHESLGSTVSPLSMNTQHKTGGGRGGIKVEHKSATRHIEAPPLFLCFSPMTRETCFYLTWFSSTYNKEKAVSFGDNDHADKHLRNT